MASYRKHNEDALPKVIICGLTEQNIPKLIFCEDKIPTDDRICTGKCNQGNNQKQSVHESSYSNFSQRLTNMNKHLAVGNAGLSGIRNKLLECDLYSKNQTIETLQKNLCGLQCEMDLLSQQNAMLNEKIQQACGNQTLQSVGQARCGKNFTCLEDKLMECAENTRILENQVCQMENNLKAMKNELSNVQAERAKLDKNKKVVMVCPPVWCGPRSNCNMSPPSCNRPSPCSMRTCSQD